MRASSPPDDILIEVSGIGRDYGGGRGVADVSLRLRRGEVLGFVGPNGAGKTTTLRMLAGLVRPDFGSGQILFHDVRKMSRGSVHVGYMPQKLALYGDLTVRDNLRFRADVHRLREPNRHVDQALDDFGLRDRAGQRSSQLSGGWARRLQLAAALIHMPAVVLLDEPTAGLDSFSRQDVWRRIHELAARGAGVIVNTHDLAEAERCSRVMLFREGRIAAEGAPGDLVQATPVRAAFVGCEEDPGRPAELRAEPGVLSLEPQGRRWRMLIAAEHFTGLRSLCEARSVTLSPDQTSLADIALLGEQRSAQTAGRP